MRQLYSATREKPTVTIGIRKGGHEGPISVFLDNSNPKVLKKFHCLGCGSVVFEYFGSVGIIVPGRGNVEESLPIVKQCKTSYCKMLFYIES